MKHKRLIRHRHRMLQLRLKFPQQGHPTTAACEVCLINREDPRIALDPVEISVSASRSRRQCISVGTDVHSAGLTLL